MRRSYRGMSGGRGPPPPPRAPPPRGGPSPLDGGRVWPPRAPARAASPRTMSEGAMSAEADGPGGLAALVAPSGPWAPFVGRDRELGALRAALTDAVAGSGCLMLLSGAAGVGKTALAAVLCREAA